MQCLHYKVGLFIRPPRTTRSSLPRWREIRLSGNNPFHLPQNESAVWRGNEIHSPSSSLRINNNTKNTNTTSQWPPRCLRYPERQRTLRCAMWTPGPSRRRYVLNARHARAVLIAAKRLEAKFWRSPDSPRPDRLTHPRPCPRALAPPVPVPLPTINHHNCRRLPLDIIEFHFTWSTLLLFCRT